MNKRIPDATALSDFETCAELYRARHVLDLIKDGADDALHGGSAWHSALKIWFSNAAKNADTPLSLVDSALAALVTAWGEEPLFPAGPVKRPRGLYENLLRVYAEKWPRERDPFSVERNEEWCEGDIPIDGDFGGIVRTGEIVAIPGPQPPRLFSYGGIVDRLIRMDGRNYVMDSKTTSANLSDTYFAQYVLNSQMRGYVALELVNGRECDGIYIDAVHVDTRTQKAKPEHCVRWGPHRYRQDQLSSWARDAEHRIREIERLRSERGDKQRWPQDSGSCWKFNRRCPMWERCSVPEELAESMTGYHIEAWEPAKRGSV